MTKDEAIANAMKSSQPEVSLAIDNWFIISGDALAAHEYRIGELAQTKRRLAECMAGGSEDADGFVTAPLDWKGEFGA